MRRLFAVTALIALTIALALPAGAAAPADSDFALTGEARALEIALGEEGVTLGLALSRADSKPSALGVGAAQCALLGDDPDPDDLPCNEENTEESRYPGSPNDGEPSCAAGLPAPLDEVLKLNVACGSSKAGLKRGLPTTRNLGKVAELNGRIPVGALLPVETPSEVDDLVDELTEALTPILDKAPKEVRDAVEGVVGLLEDVAATDVIRAKVGPATSNIVPKGSTLTVDSFSAGALIGLVGIPTVAADGSTILQPTDPLTNGLVIIEVGTAQATASVDTKSAASAAEASPALVTVKIRDITKDEPTYVTVSIAPGETVTILEGTPAESTITAADSVTEEGEGSARAAADAVRLHLLKGVQGGLKVGLARATAAASVAAPAPKIQDQPPVTLPVTGGTDLTGLAIGLLAAAAAVGLVVRRWFTSR
ncbi:MAG: hypothetical protein ACRDKB_02340 [Actinomycetota bacterium]